MQRLACPQAHPGHKLLSGTLAQGFVKSGPNTDSVLYPFSKQRRATTHDNSVCRVHCIEDGPFFTTFALFCC
jgi:hypothetical protein